MYQITYGNNFKKSLKKLIKSGLKKNVQDEIKTVINLISSGEKLDISYRDHKLQGEYEGYRECHIQGNLLLVYQILKDELVLVIINIGTHSELF